MVNTLVLETNLRVRVRVSLGLHLFYSIIWNGGDDGGVAADCKSVPTG